MDQINYVMVTFGLKKTVDNFQVNGENGVHSDHQAFCVSLRTSVPKKTCQKKNVK